MLLMVSADFFRINFFKEFCQEHFHSVKQFGQNDSPDLGPNCLERQSADDKSHHYQGKSKIFFRECKHNFIVIS